MKLFRRGYKVNVGRNADNTEVDFACEKSGKYKYIQVSYRLTSKKTLDCEITPLLKIHDKYESILITAENHDFSKDGVRHLNILISYVGRTYRILEFVVESFNTSCIIQ